MVAGSTAAGEPMGRSTDMRFKNVTGSPNSEDSAAGSTVSLGMVSLSAPVEEVGEL